MSRPAPIALLIALLLAVSACGSGGRSGVARSSPTAHRPLTDLHDISQLRRAFNTASKRPRLVVLVSPT